VKRLVALLLLVVGASATSMAAVIAAPEIDPATGMSALTLLSGAIMVMRSRRK